MNDEIFKSYLRDLVFLLKENARVAKENTLSSGTSEDKAYNIGYLMAYHEVIDLMKQQAEAFNIGQEDVLLADIDPEKDLL